MFQMVVEKILIAELANMCNTTTYDEKRICCIGVSNLIADTVQNIGCVFSVLSSIKTYFECGCKSIVSKRMWRVTVGLRNGLACIVL